MPRLFISHSSKDNFEALAFRDWLIQEGWAADDVFLDLHGIGAGERWKEALAKANERCEAVVLLASPASLASIECRIEIRMAEDYGKEIIVAILHSLAPNAEELAVYRERQIVDLSQEPREASFTVFHNGQQKTIAFNRPALARIKARLGQLGISPTSFPWRPGDLKTASPYPGLKGFEEGDAALFFGRAGDIARGLAAIRKLRRTPTGQILIIQAASGAGKSSFLKAGLWPRFGRDPELVPMAILRPAGGILTGENGIGRQFAAYFASRPATVQKPTAAEIHQGLRKSDEAARACLISLINAATETGRAALRLANADAPPPTPLIAVDQAEELFAAADLEESRRFLALFASLLDPEQAVEPKLIAVPQLIWTLRADTMDVALHAIGAAGFKAPELFALPPIPRDAYRDIIESPREVANAAGMKLDIDPLLVDALVTKSTGADALPLLAFTLRQLLANNRSGARAKLTLGSFEAAGGMEGVLAARLEVARRAGGGRAEALRRLFLPHLCTWDAEANPPGAKRVIARETGLTAGPRADLGPLIEALVKERLLTRSADSSGVATLEVAHEVLLRQPPISDWLEEDREFLIWRESVARARNGFETGVRGLLMGLELEVARRWLEARDAGDVPQADRAFIGESAASDEARRRDEEATKAREEAARRIAQRTMIGAIIALLLALVAGGAGFWAWQQQQITELLRRQTQITESGLLANVADAAFGDGKNWTGITTAVLVALEALPDKAANIPRPYVAEAERQLDRANRELRELARLVHKDAASFKVLPARLLQEEIVRLLQEETVRMAAFSPDGARIVTASGDFPQNFHDSIMAILLGNKSDARVWDAASGKELARLPHEDGVSAASFSPDAGGAGYLRIVTASGNSAYVWQVARSTDSLVQIAKRRVTRCLTQAQRKQYFLPAAPPIWCITGPGHEVEKDPAKWQPKWPYQSPAWRDWLVARGRGENPPVPEEK